MLEELGVLYRGIVLGLMVAAPVGPVGLLCIRRTVQKGLVIGFATGFGAAFADALFGAAATFGVASIIELVREYHHAIHVVGGLIMLLVAWHTWHDAPRQPKPEAAALAEVPVDSIWLIGAAKALISSFVITLTNPMTLFGILALVATFGGLRNDVEALTLIGGIFAGSSLWWLMLSGGVALVRHRFTESRVLQINRVTAVMLAALAFWALVTGIFGYLGFVQINY